jgi:hypothetical protein
MRKLAFVMCLALACGGRAEPAAAQSTTATSRVRVTASVEVLLATNVKPAKVSPGFESVAARPPWNSFSSFTLMQQNSYALEPGKTQNIGLPGGGSFALTVRSGGAKPKFDYSLNGAATVSVVAEGDHKVSLSGGPFKDGTLVLLVGIKP